MANRSRILSVALAAAAILSSCREQEGGPLAVSAVGAAPEIANPNLAPLDPPSAFLLEATAQGLVRFDASGQVEPALAQSWILSNDGLRYTFRLARAEWAGGGKVTAQQVATRLRAAIGPSSRNPLKPLLIVIAEIEAMTDTVLEISLKAPRPNFLQLLAQPEMAILRGGAGTGPFDAVPQAGGAVLLTLPSRNGADDAREQEEPRILLRGESAAMGVARFRRGQADLVTGGTVGDLPIARAAAPAIEALRYDPVSGLFGLAFTREGAALADPALRRALSMAVDRDSLVAALGIADLAPRLSLLPSGLEELPAPALPDWAAMPLPMRRTLAARTVSAAAREGEPIRLRVAFPNSPGYRLVFAHLRRDWRAIGIEAEAASERAPADLRLIDSVAAANLPTWYLRRFSCAASAVCSPDADAVLTAARLAQGERERQMLLADADRLLTEVTPFLPLAQPVRWSLVSPRLTGFQPNPFGRRHAGALVAKRY